MRKRSKEVNMKTRSWISLLLSALLALPASVFAQCGMSTGSGHEHGKQGGHQHEPDAPARGVDEKAKRNAQKLLDDPRGSEALLEAILEDASFVDLLVTRILETPEGRSLLSVRLSSTAPNEGVIHEKGDLAMPPADTALVPRALYECPMHPDVTSDRAGSCPKCGMKLQRVSDRGE